MSALPLNADMCGATRDVCFGPNADLQRAVYLTYLNAVFPLRSEIPSKRERANDWRSLPELLRSWRIVVRQ
jgi:hypothetical protein